MAISVQTAHITSVAMYIVHSGISSCSNIMINNGVFKESERAHINVAGGGTIMKLQSKEGDVL